jgi:hypothetical protein
MPAVAALTIADGATTPVNRTFAFGGFDVKGVARWFEKTAGVAIGYLKLTDEYREAKSSTGANSRIFGYEFPVVATVNGVTTRVRVSSAQVRLNFAQDATDQEKKDAVAYVINHLSNATVRPAIWGQEPFY